MFSTTLVLVALFALCGSQNIQKAKVGVEYSFNITTLDDVVLEYPEPNTENPYRIHVWSEDAYLDHPVLVVVRQERRVTSWQIPLIVKNSAGLLQYQNTSRTLCCDTKEVIEALNTRNRVLEPVKRNFSVSLATSCTENVSVSIQVVIFDQYFIEKDRIYQAEFSPSEPVYYSYTFKSPEEDEIKTSLIRVSSDDEVCFTVSVQPRICPVFDLNDDVKYQGRYQTISKKGGLMLAKRHYPDGFLLVFVAKGDNTDCTQRDSLRPFTQSQRPIQNRTAKVSFEIKHGKTRDEYISATLIIFFTIIGFCIFMVFLVFIFYFFGRYRQLTKEEEKIVDKLTDDENVSHLEMVELKKDKQEKVEVVHTFSEDEVATYLGMVELKLSHFIRNGNRNRKKALNYFWHICNIAIFYGIPVIQLMVAYQRAVDASGNLDMCYHNFYCSHPLYFTDFNHIFSNIGYILIGILFFGIILFKSRFTRNKPNCGVPKLYGLYYAMAFALICEGVLSACYHICPNQSNFQFDTSFMYIMSVLIMVKLYQNRHPDINASAYGTFTVVGIAVLLAMFGILYNSVIVMVIFVVCYIIFCVYLAFKIYFFGHVWKGLKLINEARKEKESITEAIKPIRISRFIILVLANIVNFAIAIWGFATYPQSTNFASYLLGIFLLNAVLYAVFYLVMKFMCGEKICFETILYGILSLISWVIGVYFFVSAVTEWSMPPAQSRQLNDQCIFLDFYDTHDIWHLVSAPALFFSFMFLMTLDDDLFDKPQEEIHVF